MIYICLYFHLNNKEKFPDSSPRRRLKRTVCWCCEPIAISIITVLIIKTTKGTKTHAPRNPFPFQFILKPFSVHYIIQKLPIHIMIHLVFSKISRWRFIAICNASFLLRLHMISFSLICLSTKRSCFTA